MRVSNLISFIGPGGFGTPDDVEILESCQRAYAHRGLGRSDFSRGLAPGTLHHTDEAQNRAFWRAWAERMEPGAAGASPPEDAHLAEDARLAAGARPAALASAGREA